MKNILMTFLLVITPQAYAQDDATNIDFDQTDNEFVIDEDGLNDNISIRGYTLNSESVIKDYKIADIVLDHNFLIKHIIKSNSAVKFSEAQNISKNIIKASSCLGLDPWILTGLIYKESAFNRNATSPTNAAGLTQFTSVGIKEVNDQLGLRGAEGAKPAATEYFRNQIAKCINPNWIDVWDQVTVQPDQNGFSAQVKALMKQNIEIAITYGAVLLKTYVSHLDSRNTRNGTGLETYELYYNALQMYNGEPGERRVNYAKGILRHIKKTYPAPIDFPKINL